MTTNTETKVIGMYPLTKQDALRLSIYVWSGNGTNAAKRTAYAHMLDKRNVQVRLRWEDRSCFLCDFADQTYYLEHGEFPDDCNDRCPHCPMYNRWLVDPTKGQTDNDDATLPMCFMSGTSYHVWRHATNRTAAERRASRRVQLNMQRVFHTLFPDEDIELSNVKR